jgi:hypothetical protein
MGPKSGFRFWTHKRHWPSRNPATQQSPAMWRYVTLSVGSAGGTGSETARVHHAYRRCGCLAAGDARAGRADRACGRAWSHARRGPGRANHLPVFLAELRKLGFERGRNLLAEYRSFGQDISQAAASVNELIARKADALFVFGPEFPLKAAARLLAAHYGAHETYEASRQLVFSLS